MTALLALLSQPEVLNALFLIGGAVLHAQFPVLTMLRDRLAKPGTPPATPAGPPAAAPQHPLLGMILQFEQQVAADAIAKLRAGLAEQLTPPAPAAPAKAAA